MSWHLDGALQAAAAGHDTVIATAPTLYFDNRQSDLAERAARPRRDRLAGRRLRPRSDAADADAGRPARAYHRRAGQPVDRAHAAPSTTWRRWPSPAPPPWPRSAGPRRAQGLDDFAARLPAELAATARSASSRHRRGRREADRAATGGGATVALASQLAWRDPLHHRRRGADAASPLYQAPIPSPRRSACGPRPSSTAGDLAAARSTHRPSCAGASDQPGADAVHATRSR